MDMLLAQTFTKVLTSLLSLVTDPFCCGMFALFKTESGSKTVNTLMFDITLTHSEQDQSDCSGVHGGPAGGDNWLGLQGEIQQKKCFRGSLMPKTFVSA